MPSIYYSRNFRQNNYYHIFNRGANKLNIFKDKNDYLVFTDILKYYLKHPTGMALSNLNRKPKNYEVPYLVKLSFELHAYCLMPNHFHLLVYQKNKPKNKNNIQNFMKRLTITYSMFTKYKYKRSGTLFQGKYKNVLVDSKEQLIHLSKYIHRNPLPLLKSQPLSAYPYSSYQDYLGNLDRSWLKTSTILGYYPKNPIKQYQKFVEKSNNNLNLLGKTPLDA